MSRLIDEFRKSDQTAVQPMGFRAARKTAPAARMPLIAAVETGTKTGADLLTGAGAVLLMPGKTRPTAKAIQTTTAGLPDIPWGIYLDDDSGTLNTAGEGCDFVVFTASGSISATPGDEEIGRILQVESSMDDGLLRAVSDLPVDAVLVADTVGASGSLVWHQLMIIQHLARLISKPMIVSVPVNIGKDELKALWEAGADGLLVEVDAKGAGGLKEVRKAIEKLPPRSQLKRDKMEALLPRTGGESRPAAPPDEEEDDEYE